MQSPAMTYSPSYYHDHGRVVPLALSPTNDPPTVPGPSSQSLSHHTDSCSKSQSLNLPLTVYETHHVRQTRDSDDMPHGATSEMPAFFSGSSVVSNSHLLAARDPSGQGGKEHAALPAAFVLHSETEAGSISDSKAHHGPEQRGAKQPKTGMYSTDSVSDHVCNRVSIYADDDGNGGDDDDDDELNSVQDENALYILMSLSFLVPPFSILTALYTFFALLFLIALSPLRLCPPANFFHSTTSFSAQACRLLLPLFHVHQRLICPGRQRDRNRNRHGRHRSHSSPRIPTPPPLRHHHDDNPSHSNARHHNTIHALSPPSSPSSTYSISSLILIHLISPLFIIPLLFSAWIAAFFWIFATILGNPDGTEGKDDGRAAVLGVRNWWRSWLGRARRRKKRDVRISEAE